MVSKSSVVESKDEPVPPSGFDPDVPQPTVEDVRCRLRCNYVVTQVQVRALLETFDLMAYDYRMLLIRLQCKAAKANGKADEDG